MTTLGFVLLIITWIIVGLATKDRKHTPQTINHNQNLATVYIGGRRNQKDSYSFKKVLSLSSFFTLATL